MSAGVHLGTRVKPTDVYELEALLDEKYWNVVADKIPVTLFSVELDSKATNISDCISTSSRTLHSREAEEDRCLATRVGQHSGTRDICSAFEQRELSMGRGTSGVDDAFGNALVIESVDL